MLDQPVDAIAAALAHGATLPRTGLLWIDDKSLFRMSNKLELLSELQEVLLDANFNVQFLLQYFFADSRSSRLLPGDFSHIEQDFGLLHDYLKAAQARGTKGVNILLYGPPGTGKSELARVLASECGLSAYEVADQDRHGNPIKGEKRFRAFQLGQHLLARSRKHLLIFDEIEDVFPDFGPFGDLRESQHKSWLNRLLESNPVPAIWISNIVHQIDPAALRPSISCSNSVPRRNRCAGACSMAHFTTCRSRPSGCSVPAVSSH